MEYSGFQHQQQSMGMDKAVCAGIYDVEFHRNVMLPSAPSALCLCKNFIAAYADGAVSGKSVSAEMLDSQ